MGCGLLKLFESRFLAYNFTQMRSSKRMRAVQTANLHNSKLLLFYNRQNDPTSLLQYAV